GTNVILFVPILGVKAHLPSQLSFSGMKCSHHMLGAAHVIGRDGCAKATVGQTFQGTDFLTTTLPD
ncbi:hypothetical protein L208DRAFT_1400060, partial [Tricholoma matsutake]